MKIVICDTLSSKVLEELQSIGNCIDISSSLSKEQALDTEIAEAEILVIRSSTKLTKEIMEKGNNLKIIARCGVGIDNIDVEYAKSKNIKITNSPTANLLSVVELTVALIINAARKINLSDNHLKDGKWNRKEFIGMELSGKQLGIVGYGKVPEEYRYVSDSHTDGKNTKGSEESREKDERALEEGKEYALNDPIWDKRWTVA